MKVCLILLFALSLNVPAAENAQDSLPLDHAARFTRGLELFQQSIRPLLNEHCVKCHGGEKTKGEFNLTTREGLLKGGVEGPAVKLYDAKASRKFPFCFFSP